MPEKLFRIEREDGGGLFRDTDSGFPGNFLNMPGACSLSEQDVFAAAYANSQLRFAFTSLNVARQYAERDELARFAADGFAISVYVTEPVARSSVQAVFNPETARRAARIPLEEWHKRQAA